jgi:hypothetical protein
MSDVPQGPGWWRASNGQWYPPEAATPTVQQPVTPSGTEPPVQGPPLRPLGPPEGQGRRWKTWQALALAGVTLLIGIAIGAASKSSKSSSAVSTSATTVATSTTTTTTAPTTTTRAPTTTVAPTTAPPTTTGNITSDKNFTMTTFQLKAPDFSGDFAATARIRNDNSSTETAVWRVSLFKGATLLGSVQGSGQSVAAGQTITVDMISQDKYAAGMTRYELQTETNFPG